MCPYLWAYIYTHSSDYRCQVCCVTEMFILVPSLS
jgi:hypothetical protein